MNFWSIRGLRFVLIVLILCICISPVFAGTVYTKAECFHIEHSGTSTNLAVCEITIILDGPAHAAFRVKSLSEQKIVVVYRDATDQDEIRNNLPVETAYTNQLHKFKITVQPRTPKNYKIEVLITDTNSGASLKVKSSTANTVVIECHAPGAAFPK